MSAYVESIIGGGEVAQKFAWMRHIKIVFRSKYALDETQRGVAAQYFANNPPGDTSNGVAVTIDSLAGDNLNIRITGTKFLALTKDNGTIMINNVSYETIALIQTLKLYNVEIWAGYKDNNLMRIAKGEVTYLSQKIHSRHDTALYITYASELVAAWSQNRINFSMRSGTNAYAMLEYFFRNGNGTAAKLSPALRQVVYDQMWQEAGKPTSIVESCLSNAETGLFLSADSSLDDKVINITELGEKRVIPIDSNMVNIGNGNPTVTSQGLDITLFPIYNLVPGDIIQVENKILDFSQGMTDATSVYQTFNTNYMDPDGCYMIRQLQYTLENRGQNFYYKIQAISPRVYEGVTGVMS